MRIIVIGDIHGRNIWKDIVNKESKGRDQRTHFVFLGDYFDSFDIPLEEQIGNFQDILEFCKKHYGILLTGNHDYHYLVEGSEYSERYSGFQSKGYPTIHWLLTTANLRIVARYKNFLFSHAGITNAWLKSRNLEHLEDLNDFNLKEFRFDGIDMYGDDVTQGPLWVRPGSLEKDGLREYNGEEIIQVVGHTRQDAIDLDGRNIYCDTLEVGEYLIINDLCISVGKVNTKVK